MKILHYLKDMLGHIWTLFYWFEGYDTIIFIYMTVNIFVVYVMCKNKLELLRKTVANARQPPVEDDYEKVVVKILFKGL